MKKSWAMKWVKALRSGKYQQTTESLRDDKGHCCLGVLCALTPYKNNYTKMPNDAGNKYESLPIEIKTLVGCSQSDPIVPFSTDGAEVSLSSLNDDHNKSFAEIADIIEQNWKKL